ncbi:hypothetical protein DCAR_0727555 [Daucus carota subsp. sativus]|uniref:PDZ domain-containing protein n=1 Tax=Daucus carota subsp. sativus TaxID=79200 RepID=A0A161ZLD7_DAUCS|nr:PREDICTED: putative protease Do-like 14 [Daucus carota subsp. sativus]XP_017217608.1 PREDICTED: putative protease Do-like 14 [Daucus carota subsp. sativus]XP_017217610.1 PREDICTED: putative protease Do-like 14 [Daucus carota subsp. sativus]WOH08118.1 hypothetical protein DCAR_0727555 [Daucus carota subsp. sativus]
MMDFRKNSKKLKVDYHPILDTMDMDITTKVFGVKSSPFVVAVVSRNLPVEMTGISYGRGEVRLSDYPGEHVVLNSGTIIECEEDAATSKFVSTIIVAAVLFVRTNDVQPHDIKVDVHLFDGRVCQGQVFACDFHYNLAAVRIQTDSPLQTPTLKGLDDVMSIDPSELLQLSQDRSFQLRPHSNLFKIFHGMKIITIWRALRPKNFIIVSSGVLCIDAPYTELDCNELCWVKDRKEDPLGEKGENGGTIVNCFGDVIGMLFYGSAFMPINIVLRWWHHFKSCRNYRRPWLGVEISNLYSSRLEILEQFMSKFPNISAGVVVMKVEEDSPAAHCSTIHAKDVIVACDGKLVRSKLDLFELLWDKVGDTVELNVVRPSNGNQLKVNVTVGESTPDRFYRWPLIHWTRFHTILPTRTSTLHDDIKWP